MTTDNRRPNGSQGRHSGHASFILLGMIAVLGISACGVSKEEPRPADSPAEGGKAATKTTPALAADPDSARLANAVVTGKGGAAVDLRYDLPARPVIGQPIELELVFEPRATADALEVELSAVPGVTIVDAGEARFAPVASGQRHTSRVLLNATADGLYYLNVIARMVSKVQTEARTFSVPLVVGGADAAAPDPASAATGSTPDASPAGEPAVKSLPAESGTADR